MSSRLGEYGLGTLNASLPYALKNCVDEQVASRGYGLRGLLLESAASPGSPPGGACLKMLRWRLHRAKRA